MQAPHAPFFREAGTGPGVICLHANASSSGQWRALMERLAPCFHVLAPDAHGAARGPAWPAGRAVRLADEAAVGAGQARTLYRGGKVGYLESLDAERALAASEAALATSDALLVDQQVQLFLAPGGGWES